MTVPAQRTDDDLGDGWAARLAHAEHQRDAAQRDNVALQAQLDDLRLVVLSAYDYLEHSPLPAPAAADAALRTLRDALAR